MLQLRHHNKHLVTAASQLFLRFPDPVPYGLAGSTNGGLTSDGTGDDGGPGDDGGADGEESGAGLPAAGSGAEPSSMNSPLFIAGSPVTSITSGVVATLV